MIKKIPAGKCIYLTKKCPDILYIKPDKTLVNDNLYVAYDVKVEGVTVIPKGTRVIGDWVAESYPTIAAQLQVKRIYLQGSGQEIAADSDVIEGTTCYNCDEICGASYLYGYPRCRTSCRTRRMVKLQCCSKTLADNDLDTIYVEIFTEEIKVYLTADFIPFPCLERDQFAV